jgi:hypothetical protein
MLKNNNHNLIHQLSEISDSAWRMNKYIDEANECEACRSLWSGLLSDYEKHITLLKGEMSRHVSEGKFE